MALFRVSTGDSDSDVLTSSGLLIGKTHKKKLKHDGKNIIHVARILR